jgi:serine phosphatase RsbU (regulator of sigma subunit)
VELGVGGLAEILAGSRALPLTDALDALLDHIRRHCAGRPLDDDVTLLLVERSGEPPAAAAAAARGGPGAVI